jgi:site-specific recombinase XerC
MVTSRIVFVFLSITSMDRKIGLAHMAFYRDWLHGLTLREAAEIHLDTGPDLGRATQTLERIQHSLRQAALQHGRYGEARLLRIRLGVPRGDSSPTAAATFDAFRAQAAPDDFAHPNRLIVRTGHRPGFDERAERHALLLERQVAALNWLEQRVLNTPAPTDALADWLDESNVAKLTIARLITVGDLFTCITNRGYRWYAVVPGLGRIRAARLVRWLQSEAASLGALPSHTVIPPHIPLLLAQPSLLNDNWWTSTPESLSPTWLADTVNDRAAIIAWLDSGAASPAVRREHRKEAERLLLWIRLEGKQSLARLSAEDAEAYRDFLLCLGRTPVELWPFQISQAEWCASHASGKSTWRPFEGALHAHAIFFALSVVRSLFAWLTAITFVTHDPWLHVASPTVLPGPAPDFVLSHQLTAAAWTGLRTAVARLTSPYRERADALLWLAVMTGLGRVELSGARSDHLYRSTRMDGSSRWLLKVPSRQGRWRSVPLPEGVMQRLGAWWRINKHSTEPEALPAGLPLVGQVAPSLRDRPLTPTGILLTVRKLFVRGRAACREAGEWQAASVLAKASTYWLPACRVQNTGAKKATKSPPKRTNVRPRRVPVLELD